MGGDGRGSSDERRAAGRGDEARCRWGAHRKVPEDLASPLWPCVSPQRRAGSHQSSAAAAAFRGRRMGPWAVDGTAVRVSGGPRRLIAVSKGGTGEQTKRRQAKSVLGLPSATKGTPHEPTPPPHSCPSRCWRGPDGAQLMHAAYAALPQHRVGERGRQAAPPDSVGSEVGEMRQARGNTVSVLQTGTVSHRPCTSARGGCSTKQGMAVRHQSGAHTHTEATQDPDQDQERI